MRDVDMQPCRKECPGRSAICKVTCPKWQKWEAQKRIKYKEHLDQSLAVPDLNRIRIGSWRSKRKLHKSKWNLGGGND